MQESVSEPEIDFFTPRSNSDSERASDGSNNQAADFICSTLWDRTAVLCSQLAESSIHNSKNFTSQAPFDATCMNEDFICTQRDLQSEKVESLAKLIASWSLDSDTAETASAPAQDAIQNSTHLETDGSARSESRKFSKFREKFSPVYWKNCADTLWRRFH